MRRISLLAVLLAATAAMPAQATITFTGSLAVAGEMTDLSGVAPAMGGNRLSFGSDLTYDSATDLFYGITDRGPGGGLISYAPRLNIFKLDTNATTGAINGFSLQRTILFRDSTGATFDGLNPQLLNGSVSTLGRSFDPEGFARLKNGNFLVSDEYGPSIYVFDQTGRQIGSYQTPDNLIPRAANGSVDYVSDRNTVVTGRQDNRGFEGITVSVDGTRAYAVMQDPLVNEGAQNDGRLSRNLRIVEFDTANGQSTRQFVYQLEDLSDINGRIPGTSNDFAANTQGRSIGLSSISANADGSFLVIERDNRGLGVDDPTGAKPIGTKRVYRITLDGATDVSQLSLAGTSTLPANVKAVNKSLYLDIQAALGGLDPVEKLEGLTFGKAFADGSLSLFIASDNDFSVTQTGMFGLQSDVCTTGDGGVSQQVAIGAGCTIGKLIPTMVYGFRVSGAEAAVAVPEPASWAMMIAGFGAVGGAMRRRRTLAIA